MKYLFSLLLLILPLVSAAAEVSVAVASNFTAPMREIAAAFEQQSGYRAILAFGSSGKFYAQIHNGAPFQLFLSADQSKPAALEQDGLTVSGSRFTYALGTLALLTANEDANPEALLRNGDYRKLALANPRLAPYGAAAMEVLAGLGLTDTATPRLVLGENIAQTYQFVISGNAQLGFVARSQVAANDNLADRYWLVPNELYQPIRQDAVLLKSGADNPAAQALMNFLRSDAAVAIMQHYGYGLPDRN
ncbi:molybdate ABC transporter substrate-binding protein [Porticoccus sp.]